ncbi:glutaredoxin family protein [Demequina soli]|uniref:glutaredoxin family protein n=1 Tax=Demequina soli TaxID=1638987 RepID=UPI000782C5EE|nr:glutaredoxin family protein [Demequina soli]
MPPAPALTLVRTATCHLCDDAQDVLDTLRRDGRIQVITLDVESPVGRALLAEHRPALYPLVLVDNEFFSAGRLPRKKLARLLERVASDAMPPVR